MAREARHLLHRQPRLEAERLLKRMSAKEGVLLATSLFKDSYASKGRDPGRTARDVGLRPQNPGHSLARAQEGGRSGRA